MPSREPCTPMTDRDVSPGMPMSPPPSMDMSSSKGASTEKGALRQAGEASTASKVDVGDADDSYDADDLSIDVGGGIMMSQSQVAEQKETFDFFDKDGSGNISLQELGTAMRALGADLSEIELEAMVSELDDDKSGTITFKEFLMLMGKKMAAEANEQEYIEAFKVFDKNGDGTVDATELRYMMQHHGAYRLSDEDVDEMIREADVDGDGQLQYQEFIKLMMADVNEPDLR